MRFIQTQHNQFIKVWIVGESLWPLPHLEITSTVAIKRWQWMWCRYFWFGLRGKRHKWSAVTVLLTTRFRLTLILPTFMLAHHPSSAGSPSSAASRPA